MGAPGNNSHAVQKPVRRSLALAKPFAGLIILGALLSLGHGAVLAGLPWLIRDLVDDVFVAHESSAMLMIIGGLGGLVLLKHAFSFGQTTAISRVQTSMLSNLQTNLFSRIIGQPYPFFTLRPSGDIIAALTADVHAVVAIVFIVTGELLLHPLAAIGLIASMVAMDWRLAIFALAVIPLIALPLSLVRQYVRKNSAALVIERSKMYQAAEETLSGIKVIKAYGREDAAGARFAEKTRGFYSRVLNNILAQAALSPVPELLGLAGFAAGLLVFQGELAAGGVTTGEIIAFLAVLMGLYRPVSSIATAFVRIESNVPSAARVLFYMDIPSDEETCSEEWEGPIEEIRLEGVSFGFNKEKAVLKDFGMTARRGEFVAVSGPSGSGKTTICDLILAFRKPDAGRILLNGRDAALFSGASLRRRVGIVTQDTFLLYDTVGANIRMGKPDATDDTVLDAADRANIGEFIGKNAKGLDAIVSRTLVSGGEAQRISLARALVRDASLVLLDEATSAVDKEGERRILEAVRKLAVERTVIFFTHKQSVLDAADRVVELGG